MADINSKPEPMSTPDGLKLLITIVNSSKADIFADVVSTFGSNMQLFSAAEGTAKTEMMNYLGLSDTGKTVIFSVIRSDRANEALAVLKTKFKTVKYGKGIAFTVPMTGTIGVLTYRFLADKRDT